MTKEDIIFALLKDQPIQNRRIFTQRLKQKYPDLNVKDLFLRIVNYQIINYGSSMDDYDFRTKEMNGNASIGLPGSTRHHHK